MASLSLSVNVTITKSTRTVTQQAFGVPVIFGPSNRFVDPYRVYNSPTGMITDGFMTSDPEYIHAVALTSQAIKPSRFLISKFTPAVAQVDTFMVNTLTASHNYQFTLNSIVISYTSTGLDTQQSILSALLTAIGVAFPTNPPVSGSVVGTGPSATLTLTSTVPGVGVSYTAIDSQLTHALMTANHTIVTDIQTLQGVVSPADQFYGILVTSKIASDIEQIAAYIETQLLVYVAATLDSNCLTTSTTDVMSVLKGKSFDRTMTLYSAEANTAAPDAAWMGYMLPTQPGIGNWAYKTLKGVDADNLNPTQISKVLGKNGNLYLPIGGIGVTLFGIAASGEFFDVTIFLDWLASTMQTNVFSVLTDPANLKIPYNNKGISQLENPVRQTMQQGQDNQGLNPGWTVSAPDIASVPTADKSTRTLNNLDFNGTLAGAINVVNITGNVSV